MFLVGPARRDRARAGSGWPSTRTGRRRVPTGERIAQAFLGLFGIAGPVAFIDQQDGDRAAIALVVLGAAVLLVAVSWSRSAPADGPHGLDAAEDARLRTMLDRWGGIDSLSYFSLREDRSVIFSPTGKAAITYRVVGTVSLAAGTRSATPRPGPAPSREWLTEARSFGWVPAVLAASERGAEAFHRFGLDALELGDEAILHTAEFSLEGRSMRGVRQAVSRCERAGLVVTCHRVGTSTTSASRWCASGPTSGGTARSSAASRWRWAGFGERADGRSVVALCRDGDGVLRGLLHLVPWGSDGLSLDLMRRDRTPRTASSSTWSPA